MAAIFMLAPMAELSHRGLRELIERFGGCDEYFTEMISAGALLAGGPWERWYADNGPRPEKLVYQILGNDPGTMARAAALLESRGCRGIDLNMGCAAPAITRTGAGVRWLESPDRAADLIRRVRPVVKGRLSVKLRLPGAVPRGAALPGDGGETSHEKIFETLVAFCRRLEAEGVDLITLHPRTAKEKFRRRARLEDVAALRGALGIPVAGNGDIADAGELLRRAGEWDAAMAGRLALRRPWVFAAARALEAAGGTGAGGTPGTGTDAGAATPGVTIPGASTPPPPLDVNLEEVGMTFLDLLALHQPPEFHLSRARRFFSYFCDNLTWANYLKTLLNREPDLAGIGRVWHTYFHGHASEARVGNPLS